MVYDAFPLKNASIGRVRRSTNNFTKGKEHKHFKIYYQGLNQTLEISKCPLKSHNQIFSFEHGTKTKHSEDMGNSGSV